MPKLCQGRSPDQPCCFGVGKQIGKRATNTFRCAFCDNDDLKMAIENKKQVQSILKKLRVFTNEVNLLMSAHVICAPVS